MLQGIQHIAAKAMNTIWATLKRTVRPPQTSSQATPEDALFPDLQQDQKYTLSLQAYFSVILPRLRHAEILLETIDTDFIKRGKELERQLQGKTVVPMETHAICMAWIQEALTYSKKLAHQLREERSKLTVNADAHQSRTERAY